MRVRVLGAGLVALTCLGVAVRAADPAFVGTWKVNVAQSKVTGDTVTIGPAASGMMSFNSQGFSYTFKLDGHEYPMPDGGTTSWTATSSTVWEVTNRLNGKVTSAFHLVLAGDSLSAGSKIMKQDGGSIDSAATYTRVSGGPGFAGTWMSTEVKMPVTAVTIAADGANGVLLSDDTGPFCRGQFDSKDNASLGMAAGSKATCALRKVSDHSFEITSKINGKLMYVDVYVVSADGKTLTDTGTPSNAKQEGYKIVFNRQ